MRQDQPRPERHYELRNKIAEMRIGDVIFTDGECDGSVRSIVSRLRKHFKKRRRFTTKRFAAGTRVERLP